MPSGGRFVSAINLEDWRILRILYINYITRMRERARIIHHREILQSSKSSSGSGWRRVVRVSGMTGGRRPFGNRFASAAMVGAGRGRGGA